MQRTVRTVLAMGSLILATDAGTAPVRAGNSGFGIQLSITDPALYGGEWVTRTSVGGDYMLSLTFHNGTVSGSFKEKNPTYNGTLQGNVDGQGALNYTFRQTSGATGHGSFKISADGRNISGSFVMDSDPQTRYQWSGYKL